MSVYLDANIVVALFVPDALNTRAVALVAGLSEPIVISDIAALEFASTLARLGRAKELTVKAVHEALFNFDSWRASQSNVEVIPADIAMADAYIRRLDVNLHGADAIHVAMAARIGAALLTLDVKMKAKAKKVGVAAI